MHNIECNLGGVKLEIYLNEFCNRRITRNSSFQACFLTGLRPFYVGDLVTLNKTGDMAMNEAVVGARNKLLQTKNVSMVLL